MLYSKLSSGLANTGLLRIFDLLPSRPGVVVLGYHRIGNSEESAGNRDLFSATAEQFDYQLSYIKRNLPTLLPSELAELTARKKRLTRLHAVLTFDDGYLDNYTVAFPLLKQHNLRAAFYLVSSFVGAANLPWWDEIGYLVRHTSQSKLSIRSGPAISVDLGAGVERAIDQFVQAYKSEANHDPAAFLQQLRTEAKVDPPHPTRQFLNWDEAKEMVDAGMEIGAHTHTHPLLSRLTMPEQRAELAQSKAIIEQKLALPITSLAYPNGTLKDFTPDTQRIAREVGYTTAFSLYGGINPPAGGDPYNILRRSPKALPVSFRTDLLLTSRLGTRAAAQPATSAAH